MGKHAIGWTHRLVGSGDRQVTRDEQGHCVSNHGAWSPDSTWIVFDRRSDAAGEAHDSEEICAAHVSGKKKVRTLFKSSFKAVCLEATFNPLKSKREIVFTLGPENPTGAWTYAPHRRRGALADVTDRLKSRPKKKSKIPFKNAELDDDDDDDEPAPDPSAPTSAPAPKKLSVFGGKAGRDHRAEFPSRILDARDLLPDPEGEFTPGALRGGTHLHSFSPDGIIVSSTYEDAVLLRNGSLESEYGVVERNHPAVALTAVDGANSGVRVDTDEHPRNQSGEGFSVVATSHVDALEPDSDGIARAVEHCWIGRRGYRRSDAAGGGWQGRAVAFLGEVSSAKGGTHLELFVLDLPVDPRALRVEAGPGQQLSGTVRTRCRPPLGAAQRRLTRTDHRLFPGLTGPRPISAANDAAFEPCRASKGNAFANASVGPRFWPRSSPDGARICVCATADDGVPQLYLVRTNGDGALVPLTNLPAPGVQSAFSWRPDGSSIAFVHDGSVCLVMVPPCDDLKPETRRDVSAAAARATRRPIRLTRRRFGKQAPRPETVCFSPCGGHVAYVRRVIRSGLTPPKMTGDPFEDDSDVDGDGVDDWFNQVCVVDVKPVLRQPLRGIKAFVSGAVSGAVTVVAAVTAHAAWTAASAALRRRALERLRREAKVTLEATPAPDVKEAWASFAADVEKAETRLRAAPLPAPKDAWTSFVREHEGDATGTNAGTNAPAGEGTAKAQTTGERAEAKPRPKPKPKPKPRGGGPGEPKGGWDKTSEGR